MRHVDHRTAAVGEVFGDDVVPKIRGDVGVSARRRRRVEQRSARSPTHGHGSHQLCRVAGKTPATRR